MIPEYSDAYVLDYDLLSSPLSTYFAEENTIIAARRLECNCDVTCITSIPRDARLERKDRLTSVHTSVTSGDV